MKKHILVENDEDKPNAITVSSDTYKAYELANDLIDYLPDLGLFVEMHPRYEGTDMVGLIISTNPINIQDYMSEGVRKLKKHPLAENYERLFGKKIK